MNGSSRKPRARGTLGIAALAVAAAWSCAKDEWDGVGPDPANFRLYVLGGSTAKGSPYQERLDFAALASYRLGGTIRGRTVEVVNLARSGKDSDYARERAEVILRRDPDPREAAVLVYMGNNEFLEFDQGHDLRTDRRTLFDEPVVSDAERARTLERFEANLDAITATLSEAGFTVILSTVAVNVADWQPNRSVLDDPANRAAVEELLARADAERSAGRVDEALRALTEAAALEPGFAWTQMRRADALRASGRHLEARAAYHLANDLDGRPHRATSGINARVARVAERHGVLLVDASGVLQRAAPMGLLGYELMWDMCHPRLEGHMLIAAGFADALIVAFDATPERALEVADVGREFGIDAALEARIEAYEGQFLYTTSTFIWNPERRLAQAATYLDRALAAEPRNADYAFSRGVCALMSGEAERAVDYWRRARDADEAAYAERLANPRIRALVDRHGVTAP